MKFLYLVGALILFSCTTNHPVTSVHREAYEPTYKKDERLEKVEKNTPPTNSDISTAVILGSSESESSRQSNIKAASEKSKPTLNKDSTIMLGSDSTSNTEKSANVLTK